jgi:hypothetical protein
MLAMGTAPASASASTGRPMAANCMEDEPCFVWHSMGNGARGVILKGHTAYTVVDCPTYAKLRAEHRLSVRNPHLKGDGWAAKHCYEGTR